jgi:drug/metabolite transporter (DMT)-like permease
MDRLFSPKIYLTKEIGSDNMRYFLYNIGLIYRIISVTFLIPYKTYLNVDMRGDSLEVRMETKVPARSVLIAFALVILFAGNNAIAVRFSNIELPPFFGAAIRFAAAALILFLIVIILRLPLPRGRGLLGAVIFGLLGAGLNVALLYWALEHVKPGIAMVVLALVPLLTFLFACAHQQEVFSWKALFGALLAVFGIGIVFREQINANVPLLPLLAVVGAAICFAESTVLVKSFPQTHPITTNAIALTTGSVLLFVLSAIWQETPTLPTLPATWLSLFYLIIFGSVATFVLTLYVVKHWTASASAYQFVLIPFVTIPVSAFLVKESISVAFLIGGIFVLAGAYIGGIARTEQLNKVFNGLFFHHKAPTPEC